MNTFTNLTQNFSNNNLNGGSSTNSRQFKNLQDCNPFKHLNSNQYGTLLASKNFSNSAFNQNAASLANNIQSSMGLKMKSISETKCCANQWKNYGKNEDQNITQAQQIPADKNNLQSNGNLLSYKLNNNDAYNYESSKNSVRTETNFIARNQSLSQRTLPICNTIKLSNENYICNQNQGTKILSTEINNYNQLLNQSNASNNNKKLDPILQNNNGNILNHQYNSFNIQHQNGNLFNNLQGSNQSSFQPLSQHTNLFSFEQSKHNDTGNMPQSLLNSSNNNEAYSNFYWENQPTSAFSIASFSKQQFQNNLAKKNAEDAYNFNRFLEKNITNESLHLLDNTPNQINNFERNYNVSPIFDETQYNCTNKDLASQEFLFEKKNVVDQQKLMQFMHNANFFSQAKRNIVDSQESELQSQALNTNIKESFFSLNHDYEVLKIHDENYGSSYQKKGLTQEINNNKNTEFAHHIWKKKNDCTKKLEGKLADPYAKLQIYNKSFNKTVLPIFMLSIQYKLSKHHSNINEFDITANSNSKILMIKEQFVTFVQQNNPGLLSTNKVKFMLCCFYFYGVELEDNKTLGELFPEYSKDKIVRLQARLKFNTIKETAQVLPRSTLLKISSNYHTTPNLNQLAGMDKNQLSSVENFKIKNEYGSITFPGKTDLNGLNLKKIVVISYRCIEVYPEGEQIPKEGYGLNKPAILKFKKVFDEENLMNQKLENKAKRWAKSKPNAEYLGFDPINNTIKIKVPNFEN